MPEEDDAAEEVARFSGLTAPLVAEPARAVPGLRGDLTLGGASEERGRLAVEAEDRRD